jgi:uncharacterized protein YndB with AHSA1/START domain
MTTDTPRVRVSRRFDASAERVFDAWLDPEKAGKFLFATPTGTMVRAEIDPRVGGTFCFVDRRDGEDVAHTGTYLEIDRPRRLVFSFAVPKYSAATTRVIVEIVPREAGCELTLTHEGVLPEYRDRTVSGWTNILEQLAAAVTGAAGSGAAASAPAASEPPATCGAGLAAHAPLPETAGALFDALARMLDAHQEALDLTDEQARPEHHAYLTLVHEFRATAMQLESIARRMRGYASLPMGRHDMELMAGARFRDTFERYVAAERALATLLASTVSEHDAMLTAMRETAR